MPEGLPPTDLPLIAFALGDRPDALLAASTFAFDFFQIRALDHALVAQPVRFRLLRAGRPRRARGAASRAQPPSDPPAGLELPFAGLVAISFVGGAITTVRVCPHSGHVGVEEARDIAAEVVPRLAAAGFHPVAGLGTGIESLPAQIQAKERPIDTTFLVGKWALGDEAVRLEVERSSPSSAEKRAEPRHVVVLRIENATLQRRATAAISGGGHNVVWKRKTATAL